MLPVGMSAVVADARYEKLGRRVTDSEHRAFPRLRHFDDRLQIRLAYISSVLPHRAADTNGMDGWPTDDRDTVDTSANGKGRKSRKALSDWTYPVVEHGSLSAATLRRTHQRLEWSFVAQDSSGKQV